MNPYHPHPQTAQRGASLIIVLLILLVITVLGIGGAQITLQNERTTRNDRDTQIAHQAAELALSDAETDIRVTRKARFKSENLADFEPGCSSAAETRGLCAEALEGTKPAWATAFDTKEKTVPYGSITGAANGFFGTGAQSAEPPRYIIESITDRSRSCGAAGTDPRCTIYRITAMGYGPNADTKVVLQTEYRVE